MSRVSALVGDRPRQESTSYFNIIDGVNHSIVSQWISGVSTLVEDRREDFKLEKSPLLSWVPPVKSRFTWHDFIFA